MNDNLVIQRIEMMEDFRTLLADELKPLVKQFFQRFPRVHSIEYIKEHQSFCRLKEHLCDDSKLVTIDRFFNPLVDKLYKTFDNPYLMPLLPKTITCKGEFIF